MKHKMAIAISVVSIVGCGLLAVAGTTPAQAVEAAVVVDAEQEQGSEELSWLDDEQVADDESAYAANKTISQLNKWVKDRVGKCVGTGQCVALFNAYNEGFLGNAKISVSYARQLYDAAPASKWTKFKNGTLRKGDVAIWGSSHGQGRGHVALVLENKSSSTLRVFHQNWDGDLCAHKQEVSKSGIIGYLRPKNLG